jgi:hypothetical protein
MLNDLECGLVARLAGSLPKLDSAIDDTAVKADISDSQPGAGKMQAGG